MSAADPELRRWAFYVCKGNVAQAEHAYRFAICADHSEERRFVVETAPFPLLAIDEDDPAPYWEQALSFVVNRDA